MKGLISVVAGLVVLGFCGLAQATPYSGASCGNCHRASAGHMSITSAYAKNLGTARLDKLQPGALPLFIVKRGSAVNIPIKVTNGASLYSVSIQGFTKGGLLTKATNKLHYTADHTWIAVGSPAYYISSGGTSFTAAKTWTYKLTVGATTPADYYELDVTVAGRGSGMWCQTQRIYIKVTL